MIKYKEIPFEEVQSIAFDSKTSQPQAVLLQDLLKRVKAMILEEKLGEQKFIFLENTDTGEIRMEIV